MAGETVITVVGNLTADPELRYTQNGLAVANFTIASTPRNFDRASNEFKDGETLFLRASVWREFAEHVAGSLTKGTRVVATGRLKQRDYQTKEGEKRTSLGILAFPGVNLHPADLLRVRTDGFATAPFLGPRSAVNDDEIRLRHLPRFKEPPVALNGPDAAGKEKHSAGLRVQPVNVAKERQVSRESPEVASRN